MSPLDGQGLIDDLTAAMMAIGLPPPAVHHEHLPAPHLARGLPAGHGAVYVFTLAPAWSPNAPGTGRVLKVGRAGPNSDARFRSQHYSPASAGSNLAKTLLTARVLWPYLGIDALTTASIATWIKTNTHRDHFFVPAEHKDALPMLETYIRGRLGPVFEGG